MKMNKISRAMMVAGLLIASSNAFAVTTEQACATNVTALSANPTFKPLKGLLLTADITAFTNAVTKVSNFATATDADYAVLLTLANTMAANVNAIPVVAPAPAITGGRVVVALPDGTVVVDTGKQPKSVTDPVTGNVTTTGSTLANFKAKTINENHNSRLAFMDAQLWPCGTGLEVKVSTSTGLQEVSFAKRLGTYLSSAGTVRISFNK